ncbi:MAG: type II toxin-antitoxin system antitoxin, RelB/DinJ family [Alphaproteobacteria bacterium]|nr:type II toxin-antitoxin system antitoxin, RelB/DinJ family [Alphaproteobacteria bacterium]
MVKLSVDLGVETESRLAAFAAAQGINVSDAVADAVRDAVSQLLAESEKGTPYRPLGEPNAETLAAIAELERGEGKRFKSISELMADLHADD